jgi:hypothetical protein
MPVNGSRPERPGQSSLADSPLFWIVLFCGTAIFALAVIWPKHARRQARLEQMAEVREQVRYGKPGASAPADSNGEAPAADDGTSLVPLAMGIVALCALAAGVLAFRARAATAAAVKQWSRGSPRDPPESAAP